MAEIFISYARENIAFVRKLHAALTGAGLAAWVDWEGIPPVDNWLDRIRSAIDESDAFLFVISPSSVNSEVCGIELDYAVRQHKRLIPVLHIDSAAVPEVLAERNWIFARGSGDIDAAVDTIVIAADTDLDWVKRHSRLLVRAREWDESHGDTLRGHELVEYESWLQQAADKQPGPTELQTRYLLESRRAVTRRKGILWTSLVVVLAIVTLLGVYGWFQNRESLRQASIAQREGVIAQSHAALNRAESLRDAPVDTSKPHAHIVESAEAAVKAMAIYRRLGLPTQEADEALRDSLVLLPRRALAAQFSESIGKKAISWTNSAVALYFKSGELVVWYADGGREARCNHAVGDGFSMREIAVTQDGSAVATLERTDESAAKPVSRIRLVEMPSCNVRFTTELAERISPFRFVTDGSHIVITDGKNAFVWNSQTQRNIPIRSVGDVRRVALSPDGGRLATFERHPDNGVNSIRTYDLASGSPLLTIQDEDKARGIWWRSGDLVITGRRPRIHDPDTGERLWPLEMDSGRPGDAARFAAKRKQYAAAIDFIHNRVEARKTVADLGAGNKTLSLDPGGTHALAVTDKEIWQWSLLTGSELAVERVADSTGRIGIDMNGLLGVERRSGEFAVWRLPGERSPLLEEAALADPPLRLPRSHRRLLTQREGGRVRASLKSKNGGWEPVDADGKIMAASLSNDGHRLALLLSVGSTRGGENRVLEMRDLEIGKVTRTGLVRNMNPVPFLAFSGDRSEYLAVDTREGIDILDARTFERRTSLFQRGVVLLATNPDGRYVATLDGKNFLRLWDTKGNNRLLRLRLQGDVSSIAIDDDARWLATLDESGLVRLFALSPDLLIGQACRWLPAPCPDIGDIDFP